MCEQIVDLFINYESQPDTPMSCKVGSSDTTPTVLMKDVCTHFHFFHE